MMFPKLFSAYAHVGTDDDFQAWCRKQPCAFTGATYGVVYAHYRTAANSGIGMKPKYSGLPMTQSLHALQHQHGHDAVAPREEWERLVKLHLERWAKEVAMSEE